MKSSAKSPQLGCRIRELRNRLNLSLRGCAARAGVAPSFLAKIEAGRASPTIMLLQRIVEALESDLGSFFAKERVGRQTQIVYPRQEMELAEDRDRRWLFAFPKARGPGAVLSYEEYRPRTKVLERERHKGDLLGLVLAGELTLETGTGDRHRARKGDAFHLPAGLEHITSNRGRSVLKMVVVQLPPPQKGN